MDTPTITFTPNPQKPRNGTLTIMGGCSLEELYNHQQCPGIIKETLQTHITWQMRCETTLHRALNLKNQFLTFRAAMAVFGVVDIEEDEQINLQIGNLRTGSSMVRPTPAHTPIVSAFISCQVDNDRITDCHLAITGIEKRKISVPETSSLQGIPMSEETIKVWAEQISRQYPGFDDFNGSAEFRRAMVTVTIERAFSQILQEVNHG